MKRLDRARAQFERRIARAEDFALRTKTARHATKNQSALSVQHIEWALEHSLLKLVVGSEQFFEETLGLFVIGERTARGFRPKRNKPRMKTTLPHILGIFRGDSSFLGWNDADAVIRRAERWLDGGEPFRSVLSGASTFLNLTKAMRNVVGHESGSAFARYTRLTRGLYGAVPADLTPGRQLLGIPPPGIPNLVGPTLFEASTEMYRTIARGIVP